MKILITIIGIALATSAFAQTVYTRLDNNSNLDTGAAWDLGTAPDIGHIAKWTGAYIGQTPSQQHTLANDVSWGGIVIDDIPSGLGNWIYLRGGKTISLGQYGITMGATNSSGILFQFDATPVRLVATQTWRITGANAPAITFATNSPVDLNGCNLTINGTGNGLAIHSLLNSSAGTTSLINVPASNVLALRGLVAGPGAITINLNGILEIERNTSINHEIFTLNILQSTIIRTATSGTAGNPTYDGELILPSTMTLQLIAYSTAHLTIKGSNPRIEGTITLSNWPNARTLVTAGDSLGVGTLNLTGGTNTSNIGNFGVSATYDAITLANSTVNISGWMRFWGSADITIPTTATTTFTGQAASTRIMNGLSGAALTINSSMTSNALAINFESTNGGGATPGWTVLNGIITNAGAWRVGKYTGDTTNTANTYGGQLIVNGTVTFATGFGITVADDQSTLAGAGTINGNLSMVKDSRFLVLTTASEGMSITGNLDLANEWILSLDQNADWVYSAGEQWLVLSYNPATATIGTVADDFSWVDSRIVFYNDTTNGKIYLQGLAIPEPTTWALLGASLLVVTVFRKRKIS